MDKLCAVSVQGGYYEGYAKGFNEGFNKAFEQFQDMILKAPPPQIIVTTKENLDKVKQEYMIQD